MSFKKHHNFLKTWSLIDKIGLKIKIFQTNRSYLFNYISRMCQSLCIHVFYFIFFFLDMKEKAKRKDKLARHFTEGWIEFLSKRAAKEVASNLNNTLVGGKKRSKAHDVLWNIKYLPK